MQDAIYIAGPMAGYPDHNFPAFRRAALHLRRAGHRVVSPHEVTLPCGCADLPPQCGAVDHAWEDLLRFDLIALLSHASRVAVLPGWEDSRGAALETFVAERLGMEIRPLAEWLHPSTIQ